MRIAVIGSGIAGLGAAWLLSSRYPITVYEANDRLGGHSNTVTVDYDGQSVPVDTGFIVYNEATYPNLIGLFDWLDVKTKPSDMSFSVSVGDGALEYEGSLKGLVAQPANLLKPGYYRMLADVARFFAAAPRLLEEERDPDITLGDFLKREGYGDGFLYDHLLPMAAAIWSCPVETMLAFPARSFVRFFVNHGLLKHVNRPQWFTVDRGSASYVTRLAAEIEQRGGQIRTAHPVREIRRIDAGVMVTEPDGSETFYDQVVIGAHGDEALTMLSDADDAERNLLGRFTYQDNVAVLHRDRSLMPKRRWAWASWNYLAEGRRDMDRAVALTYWMNRLQGIDETLPLFVTMNPLREPDPALEFARFNYTHPVFDTAAVRAQQHLGGIQGARNTWFCGSYCGYGFHEDGLKAAIAVARGLGITVPWNTEVAPASDRWLALQNSEAASQATGDD
ncbi:FAD-dependent oxidoreductase [Nisaea acidiphila]|uniref:FAD-dependent oxidoreductase n=1 Tax=Nisaea acidiphila TaxID=1862145 RepID=A0A9J7AWE3_9PROT|nr:FAD-dependent oxidoreductase [Nisaea acidiphila]UUX49757.1 FAD-dependent oxidoreductase [Nisaea acidiphila]